MKTVIEKKKQQKTKEKERRKLERSKIRSDWEKSAKLPRKTSRNRRR